MKILAFGLGALGTVYSCLLKEQGHEVYGIDNEEVVTAVRENGLQVHGIWGDHRAEIDQVYTAAAEIINPEFDLVILSVKAFSTASVCDQLQTVMKSSKYLFLAQNGYGNFEAAAQYIPEEKIILGRVIFGAETEAPGISKVSVIADDVILGSPVNKIPVTVLDEFAEMFKKAGIPTRASEQIMQYIWGKIIYNSALNPLGAILEVPYGQLAAIDYTRSLMNEMIEEIFAVLSAIGQETLWLDANSYKTSFYGQMVPDTVAHHSSMLQDIRRGRKTEIDALNGAVVQLGKKHGVPTPTNEVVSLLLRAKETISR